MARSTKKAAVSPLRVLLIVALGIAVLGGTFVAGFRVGQVVPVDVVPFFDSHTATGDEAVPIVAPAPAPDPPVSGSDAPSGQAVIPDTPVAAPAPSSASPSEPATPRVVERTPPATPRTLARGNDDAPAGSTQRRAVYVSAGGE